MPQMPRALQKTGKPPRAWSKIIDSIQNGYLLDSATILRRKTTPGDKSTLGSPKVRELDYGPYAAKIGGKVANDQRHDDRQVVETQWWLAIACEIEPSEGDRITVVTQQGKTRTFRVPGTVNNRRSWWGQTPVWNVEVQETTEA